MVRSKDVSIDRMYGIHLTAIGKLEGRSKIEFDKDVMIDKTNNVR